MNDCMEKYLLQSWSVAYEKAIVDECNTLSKNVIDKACYYAVEDWTERLYSLGAINDINGKVFEKISDCINHHIDNLINGGMWNENNRPSIISAEDDNDHTVLIDIPVCGYRDGCKWGLNEKYFIEDKFRCQRLGCFVGAVKKYMKDDVLLNPEKVTYFMISVHKEDGCKGILFVNEGFRRRSLMLKYLDKTIS